MERIEDYGAYTVKSKDYDSPVCKEGVVGDIYRSPIGDGDKAVGHFSYSCGLVVHVENRNDFETLADCVEVTIRHLKGISSGE